MKQEEAEVIAMLREKQQMLCTQGLARLPQRGDFTPEEVVRIKAYFGPFPRALEAAGLKEPRDSGVSERRMQKRIAAKRRKTAAKAGRRNPNITIPRKDEST